MRNIGALLQCALMLMALLGVFALTLSPVQAQQDAEHDALVRALRMQQPSDPMWQAMSRIAPVIVPDPSMTAILETRNYGVPAKVFHQVFARLTWRYNPARGFGISAYARSGIRLLSFNESGAATRYAATPTDGDIIYSKPECRRIVGGRHVIEVVGYSACVSALSSDQLRVVVGPLLDVLEAQAVRALSARPPATASQPPVTQTQPPVTPPVITAPPLSPGDLATVPPPDSEPPTEIEQPPPTEETDGELTPAEIAAVSALAGGAALLGSLTMFGVTGVRRQEVLDSIRDLLRGRLPEDPYDAWRRKYEALGWKYSEKNGVGTFDPVEGARNEAGEVYSAERGGFVREGEGSRVLTSAKEGDVNDRGEVWSENDGAWVQRAYWDQERARRADLEDRRAGEIAEAERISRVESEAASKETARFAEKIAAERAANEAALAAENARLNQLYVDHLHRVMDAEMAEAARQEHWADVMATGEYASKFVLAGAKTGMMVYGAPAGWIYVMAGSGVISSVEEGARAWVSGDSEGKPLSPGVLAGKFAAGFLSGAKDGAVGRYINMPKISNLVKILLPAELDTAETLLRTGDPKKALTAGIMSGAGGWLGQKLGGNAGGSLGRTAVREVSQVALSGVMGGLGRWSSDGNIKEGVIDGVIAGIGGAVGGRLADANVPMTKRQIQMDEEAFANIQEGKVRVDKFKDALANGTPEQQKFALNRVLANRDAKILMKSKNVDADTKSAFAALTEEHRTKPLFEGTAARLNGQTHTDEHGVTTPRFVVSEPDPATPGGFREREVRPTDFKSGSASPGKAPGMDLDMYPGATIIDKSTGLAVKREHLEKAVQETCNDLRISKSRQEINVVTGAHPEQYTLRPGETPEQFKLRVQQGLASASEGRSLSEVTAYKLAEADVLHHGNTGAGAVSEQCRTVIKDHDRFTVGLLENTRGSQLPSVFTKSHARTDETPLDIMRSVYGVGDGTVLPGTADARFQKATGMGLTEGANKLAQQPEFILKIGATGTRPAAPGSYYPAGTSPGEITNAAFREALRVGSDKASRNGPRSPL